MEDKISQGTDSLNTGTDLINEKISGLTNYLSNMSVFQWGLIIFTIVIIGLLIWAYMHSERL